MPTTATTSISSSSVKPPWSGADVLAMVGSSAPLRRPRTGAKAAWAAPYPQPAMPGSLRADRHVAVRMFRQPALRGTGVLLARMEITAEVFAPRAVREAHEA